MQPSHRYETDNGLRDHTDISCAMGARERGGYLHLAHRDTWFGVMIPVLVLSYLVDISYIKHQDTTYVTRCNPALVPCHLYDTHDALKYFADIRLQHSHFVLCTRTTPRSTQDMTTNIRIFTAGVLVPFPTWECCCCLR